MPKANKKSTKPSALKLKTQKQESIEPKINRRPLILGIFKNDLQYTPIDELEEKIHSQSHFSVLYFALVSTSVLVCTLGLLTNSTAVVIGGMLIAPLTWPLARIGFGVARRKPRHIARGLILTIASIIIGTFSAYLITAFSPFKSLNDEIIARTQPTLMDLFIALAAGLVAAMAMTQKKISDSLAGVAIAVSLMPPLCAVGITLALNHFQSAGGALLLFAVNAACITLVTALAISFTIYLRTKHFNISPRAATINLVLVLILAVPLGYFLAKYSFESRSYSYVTATIDDYAKSSQSGIIFENISISPEKNESLTVSADVLVPSDAAFTYKDKEDLLALLKASTDREIFLNLRLQSVFEPVSADQQEYQEGIRKISEAFSNTLAGSEDSAENTYQISSLEVVKNEQNQPLPWSLISEIYVDPGATPNSDFLDQARQSILDQTGEQVDLKITFVPRLTLQTSDQTLSDDAKKQVQAAARQVDEDSEISEFSMQLGEGQDRAQVSYDLRSSQAYLFGDEHIENVKNQLEDLLNRKVSVRVNVIQVQQINSR